MFKNKFLTNVVNPIIKKILFNWAKHYSLEKKYNQLVVYSYDSVSSEINLDGIYEKDQIFFLEKFLIEKNFDFKNNVFVDIGAYIGNHSIYFSKKFQEVLSFEPHPTSFEILKINCKNFKNIKTYNYGCSDNDKKSYLRLKHTNIGGSTISDGNHERDYPVRLIKIDNFLKDYSKKIGLIKIDVEGHEDKVLKGTIDILKENKPIIMMELKNFNNESEPKIVKQLRSIGYNKFYELERKIKLNVNQDNIFLSIIDIIINLFLKNPIEMKEIKIFKKREYQNIIII